MQDYYQTLGVSKTATQPEIKRAFRRLAHQHHPDKNSSGDEVKFKEINEAYQVLSNPKKRSQYDQFGANFEAGSAGASGFSGFDFSGFRQGAGGGFNVNFEDFDLGDIFSDMFGFGGRRARPQSKRGLDIAVDLALDFDKVFTGSMESIRMMKEVECPRCKGGGAEPHSRIVECSTCKGTGQIKKVRQTILGAFSQVSVCPECGGEGKKISSPCTRCSGTGRVKDYENIEVKIPAGIHDGATIKVQGKGEAGVRGATAGDLYLHIRLKPSSYFTRKGDDVESELPVSFTQAALGGEAAARTWNGEVKLKIPKGTQTGKVLKLSGKGIPRLQGSGRGDHLVRVRVVTPTRLLQKEKELLQQLAVEGGQTAQVDQEKKGFWSFF